MEADRSRYLQPGERHLWQVAPQPAARGSDRLVFLSLLGILFPIFGPVGSGIGPSRIFWVREVWTGLVAPALGLIFTFLGNALVAHLRARTITAHHYTRCALGNRRAYRALQGRKQSRESRPILPKTALEIEHRKGYDNVWFHASSEFDGDGGAATSRIGFEGPKDRTEVYRLMRGLQTGTP
jgi:hypothetical protein